MARFSVEVTFLDARGKSASFDAPTTLTMTAVEQHARGNRVDVSPHPDPGGRGRKGQRTAVLTGRSARRRTRSC